MKMKMLLISILSASLIAVPSSVRADEHKDVKVDKKDKNALSEANRETHQKICEGNHGKVTAKTDNNVTIDGKRYALTADARVQRGNGAVLLRGVEVGDTLCFTTQKAADGTMQISQLMAVPADTEKVRVREKENDSPNKVEVETPNKKIEVK